MVNSEHGWPCELNWLRDPVHPIDHSARRQALTHQGQLTKPEGSLGRLEEIAIDFAGWQGRDRPVCDRIAIRIFAADHGIAARGVSAFPQAVTAQMVNNFAAGGGAINVLSRQLQADFALINLGTVAPVVPAPGIIDRVIAPQTDDLSATCAMTSRQLQQALQAGRDTVEALDAALFIGGEMGIGNTTSASALYAALLHLSASETVGPGTGVKAQTLARKVELVAVALERHSAALPSAPAARALEALRRLGGFETVALAGSYIASAQRGMPVMVDGFICTAAALAAVQINPSVSAWLMFGHMSAEPAHRAALEVLQARPLLNLQMRLGEGSGAALAARIVQAALSLHSEMVTFSGAGVSQSG